MKPVSWFAASCFAFFAFTPLAIAETTESVEPPSIEINFADMAMGSETAPAVLTEYASVTCSHCREFYEEVFPALKPRIDAGDLRFEFREYLTYPVQVSMGGLQVARCVSADQYFDVIDTLFERQKDILVAAKDRKAKVELKKVANDFGLSDETFEACLRDEALFDHIDASVMAASERGVDSTPTLFLNDEPVPRGSYSVTGLNALIDELVEKAAETNGTGD